MGCRRTSPNACPATRTGRPRSRSSTPIQRTLGRMVSRCPAPALLRLRLKDGNKLGPCGRAFHGGVLDGFLRFVLTKEPEPVQRESDVELSEPSYHLRQGYSDLFRVQIIPHEEPG